MLIHFYFPFFVFRDIFFCIRCPEGFHSVLISPHIDAFFPYVSAPEGKNKKQTLYYVFCVAVYVLLCVFYRVRGYEATRCCFFCVESKEADAMFLILPFFFRHGNSLFYEACLPTFFRLSQLIACEANASIKSRKKKSEWFFTDLTMKAFLSLMDSFECRWVLKEDLLVFKRFC